MGIGKNLKKGHNIFQEDDFMYIIFNKYKRERMVELCGESWVIEQEKLHKLEFSSIMDMGG